jgi:hypothetical protein
VRRTANFTRRRAATVGQRAVKIVHEELIKKHNSNGHWFHPIMPRIFLIFKF